MQGTTAVAPNIKTPIQSGILITLLTLSLAVAGCTNAESQSASGASPATTNSTIPVSCVIASEALTALRDVAGDEESSLTPAARKRLETAKGKLQAASRSNLPAAVTHSAAEVALILADLENLVEADPNGSKASTRTAARVLAERYEGAALAFGQSVAKICS